MEISEFLDTCNKLVPVYILPLRNRALVTVRHNYIYRRWFRPYRSEIERQRFICKFIGPAHLPDGGTASQSTIGTLVVMNGAICAEVDARRRSYAERLATGNRQVQGELDRVKTTGFTSCGRCSGRCS
ncbi:hypothetical protein QBC33DRAFT_310357 [Phialemonium atrogriseum]|uniref:Uncharacterized protein n=1 Tax=Phialemonium atrogriseum TaxID=1093897 RepID=A0AAJ0C7B0_9PEZI|nr:uncharacterized protein QBC33DRAFT_310357 [Phialemonium atrogriseum]KAK1770047.1 hypothetical protein QBC33DRAFT_310357 [Phialemonium atrogriseum]